MLYSLETNDSDNVINVSVLIGGDYLVQEMGECPSSNQLDYDDYNITLTGSRVSATACGVEPAEHAWPPPT